MGIFSGIGNGIAMRRAEEMRGESEAIAASRLRDRVLPPFNTDVDKEVRGFNPDSAERLAALRELNQNPEAKTWSTPDSKRKDATRLMPEGGLEGTQPTHAMDMV